MHMYAISLMMAGLWIPGLELHHGAFAAHNKPTAETKSQTERLPETQLQTQPETQPEPQPESQPEPQPEVLPPRLVEEPQPLYVQGRDPQADVFIALTIDEEGKVHNPEVLQSDNPDYDEQAIAHVLALRFTPATVDGEPTPVRIQYGVRFLAQARSQIEGRIQGLELLEAGQKLELELQPDNLRTAVDPQTATFAFEDLLAGSYRLTLLVDGRPIETLSVELQGDESLQLEIALPGSEAAPESESSSQPSKPSLPSPTAKPNTSPAPQSPSGKQDPAAKLPPGDRPPNAPLESEPKPAPEDADDVATVSATRLTVRQSSQTLTREQALERAGTQGDVVAAARSQPGVGRASPGKSELSLGGAVPQQSRLYIDDIPVPRLFHWGLARSILPASQVQNMRVQMVAFEANYGRAIGGSVWIGLQKPQLQKFGMRLDASWLEAAAAINLPLGKDHAISGAIRHSLQRQTLNSVLPAESSKLYPLADNFDYQVQSLHRINARRSFRVSAFGASSRQKLQRPSQDLARAFAERRRDYFHRFALHYKDQNDTQNTSAMLWAGFERAASNLAWGQDSALADTAGRVSQKIRGGFRLEHQLWLLDRVSLVSGIDGEWDLNELEQFGAPTLPPREGDIYIWGQPPGNRRAEDKWSLRRVHFAPFSTLQLFLGPKVQLSPGLRFEWYATAGKRKLPQRPTEPAVGFLEVQHALEPRLLLRWERSDYDHWQISAGLHHQSASVDDLSPRFGNPILSDQRAWQARAEVKLQPHPRIQAALSVFWNDQRDLVTRAVEPNPRVAQNLRNQGRGKNYGIQSQIRWAPISRLSLEGHYTLLYAKKKDHPNFKFRPSDLEQRHQAQLMIATRWARKFKASARAQLSSGFPRTPVVAATGAAGRVSFDPIYGFHNSTRLPLYFSTALQLSYATTWGPPQRAYGLKIWLDIQNLSNHRNVEEFYYSHDYRQRGELPGFPIFPTLGVSFEL